MISPDNATHPSRRFGLLPRDLTGYRLANHTTIIQADTAENGNVICLVVCEGATQPFVTGVLQNSRGWTHGHYFYTLGEALHDYMVRVKGMRVAVGRRG
jgi:hypothetical protein